MASITGFTASRMKEIEDSAIIDGSIVGDNLILERFDGTTLDLGVVRGPQGIQGPIGEISQAELDAAIAGIEGLPVGTITMFAGAAAPTNWGLANGQEVSRTTYADLFALIGTTYGAGNGTTTFNLPNFSSRMPAGLGGSGWSNVLAKTGGSSTAVVVDHNHSGSTNTTGSHTHTHARPATAQMLNGTGPSSTGISTSSQPPDNTGSAGSHSHTLSIGNTGESGADKNLPPYITVNFIIKLL